jgi:hypothetical protein
VIDEHQLVTSMVMGIGMILLGIIPGLLQTLANGVIGFADLMSPRFQRRSRTQIEIDDPHWFALCGIALIALASLAYLSQ